MERYRIRYQVHGIHAGAWLTREISRLSKTGVVVQTDPYITVSWNPDEVRRVAAESAPQDMPLGSPTDQPQAARDLARLIRADGGQVGISWVAYVEDEKSRKWMICAKGSLAIDANDAPTVSDIDAMAKASRAEKRRKAMTA